MKRFVMRAALLMFSICMAAPLFGGGQREGGNFSYDGISTLEVQGVTFDVEVSGGPGDRVSMDITDYPDGYTVYHDVEGSRVRVVVEREFSLFGSPRGGRLVFQVPERTELSVDNSTGDVRIRNLSDTRVELETSTGDIRVRSVSADLAAQSSTGRIELREVSGRLDLRSTTGSLVLQEVRGPVQARSTTGDQELRNVAGDVITRSSTGHVELVNVEGAVEITTTTGDQTGLDVTLTGDSSFVASTGSIEMDLTNELDALEFDLSSTTGSLRVGGDRSQRRLFLGSTGIRVRGETSTGSQRFY